MARLHKRHTHSRRFRLGSAFLVCTTALSPTAAAWAQVADGEIIVTAQKRAENLQDVPISVGVVLGESLKAMGVRNLEEVSTNTPSLLINQSPSQSGIYMRSVGSGTNNTGFEQSVGMFVDGVYMSKPRLLHQPFFDIERVEVIKGPQNVLFGKNTTAGAISITTAGPTKDFQGLVSGLYGEDGEYQVDGMVSGPLGEGVGARVAVRLSGMNGYMHDTSRDVDAPRIRDLAARATLQLDPSDALSVTLKGQFIRSRLGGGVPVIASQLSPALFATLRAVDPELSLRLKDEKRSTDAGGIPGGKEFLDIDTRVVSLSVGYDINDWKLTSLAAYAGYEYDQATDSDFTANPNAQISLTTGSKYQQFSQELRIQSPVGKPIEMMAGAYYQYSDTKYEDWNPCFNYAFFPPAAGPVSACALLGFSQVQKTSSAFVRGTWNITDALKITGGVRYTHERKSASGELFATELDMVTPTVTPGDLAGLSAFGYAPHLNPRQRRKETSWSPSVNVQYDVTDDIMTYASFNKGNKSGGFNALETRGNLSRFQFAGEKAQSIEFGTKMRYLDGRAITNIAVFFSKFDDLQVSLFNGLSFDVGNADAKVNGVEADFSLRATDAIRFSGSLAYIDAKYTRFPNGPCRNGQTVAQGCVAGFQDLTGTPLQYSAKWQGTFAVDVEQPINGSLLGKAHVDVFYSSRVNLAPDFDPRTVQPRYAKINARLAISADDEKWEVAVIGKNLTNKFTKAYENDLPGAAGSFFAHILRGRSFAGQVTMEF